MRSDRSGHLDKEEAIAPLSERDKMSFEHARDTTKQLMTLATGVIALTVTFSKDLLGGAPEALLSYFVSSWIVLLCSVALGQWCLMSLTGVLVHPERAPRGVYEKGVKIPAILQVLTFIFGLALFILAALKVLKF